MADIELVIKIPENVIEGARSSPNYYPTYHFEKIWRAIANGTPLPKGHGRILDEKDILDTDNNDGIYYDLVDMPAYIADVKEIIEADDKYEANKYEAKVVTRGNCMMCGKELTEGLFFCKECENKGNSRKR